MTAIALGRNADMPRRDGDLAVENRGIEPIPREARYGSLGRLFRLWFTSNLMPAALAVGGLAPGLRVGWQEALLAIVLGNCVGAALVGLAATIGPRTGLAQIPAARLAFGRSVAIPAAVTWATTIAWSAIYAFFGASAIQILSGGTVSLPAGLLVVALCQAVLAGVGYEAIHTFARYASVGLAVAFAVATVVLLPSLHLPATGGAPAGAFVLLATVVAGLQVSWAVSASDFSRYLPTDAPARTVWLLTFLGLAISAGWLELLGLGLAGLPANASTGAVARLNELLGGAPGVLMMVAIVVGTLAANAMSTYTGSLSLLAAGLRLPRPLAAVIGAGLTVVLAVPLYDSHFVATFEDYLLVITYWVAPWLAIVLADWWQRRGRVGEDVAPRASLPSGRNALLALIVGLAAGVPFLSTALYEGPIAVALGGADLAYLVGFVAAGVVYLALQRAPRRLGSTEVRPV